MSNNPAVPSSGRQPAQRRAWSMDPGSAETVLANARRALFVMVGILALIWAIQIANAVDGSNLTPSYGIVPRSIGSLPHILSAPFFHFTWTQKQIVGAVNKDAYRDCIDDRRNDWRSARNLDTAEAASR